MKQKKKKTATKKSHETFLFEIGIEELPASFIQISEDDPVQSTFINACTRAFEHARVECLDLHVFVTPRRITFTATIATEQKATQEELRGPSKDKAFDENGKPYSKMKHESFETLIR